MKNILHIILISFVSFTIISCAKDSDSPSSATVAGVTSTGSDGTNGINSLIKTTTESSGSNCTTGGLKIETGLDSDADNVLDSNEVSVTTYVCNGSDGTNGNNGTNGTNGIQPAASLFCDAALSGTSLRFTYSAMVFSDSSIFAYGGIYGVAFQIGSSKFYDSSQTGASTAAVLFTYDFISTTNGGWWTISVNRSTRAATILYTDTDATGGTDTWTLASSSSNCVLNSY